MSALREMQGRLQEAILAEDGAAVESRLPRGLATYRHAYRARLAAALRQGYPRLAQALDRPAFRRLADRYAREVPSRHFSIRWHGGALASLLRGAEADLGRMEWALGLAFDAADAAPIDPAALKGMAAEALFDLPLRLHPSTQVLSMSHAVGPWWESLAVAGTEAPSRVAPREHALIVWRQGLEVKWRTATSEEGEALVALHDAGSLAGACRVIPESTLKALGGWLALWVTEGLLVRTEDAPW